MGNIFFVVFGSICESAHRFVRTVFTISVTQERFSYILQGTVMQFEKTLITDRLNVSKVSENFAFQLFIDLQSFTH